MSRRVSPSTAKAYGIERVKDCQEFGVRAGG